MRIDLKPLKDEDLVGLFKEGEERAFDELYQRYAQRLKRLIYFYLCDADMAEDVLHDVFLRVFMHLGSFKIEMAFSSWIYRIAVNCCKNCRKKQKKDMELIETQQLEANEAAHSPSPEDVVIREDEMRMFQEAIESLKEKFRVVFLLRYDQGLHYSEISGILNCPERTAKWRMQKAVEKIVEYLRDRHVV